MGGYFLAEEKERRMRFYLRTVHDPQRAEVASSEIQRERELMAQQRRERIWNMGSQLRKVETMRREEKVVSAVYVALVTGKM